MLSFRIRLYTYGKAVVRTSGALAEQEKVWAIANSFPAVGKNDTFFDAGSIVADLREKRSHKTQKCSKTYQILLIRDVQWCCHE